MTILPLDPQNIKFLLLSPINTPLIKSSFSRALFGWFQPFQAQQTPQVSLLDRSKGSNVWLYAYQSM